MFKTTHVQDLNCAAFMATRGPKLQQSFNTVSMKISPSATNSVEANVAPRVIASIANRSAAPAAPHTSYSNTANSIATSAKSSSVFKSAVNPINSMKNQETFTPLTNFNMNKTAKPIPAMEVAQPITSEAADQEMPQISSFGGNTLTSTDENYWDKVTGKLAVRLGLAAATFAIGTAATPAFAGDIESGEQIF